MACRIHPHHPAIIDRIYALYLRHHGAEFAAQQLCLWEMATAAVELARIERWIKGLHDTVALCPELTGDDELAELPRLLSLRALALRRFDRAFARFAAIRADRNTPPPDGPEFIPMPERTLIEHPAYTFEPACKKGNCNGKTPPEP